MTNQATVNRFFKICAGVSLVLFSTGFLFFSLKYNTVTAGPKGPQGPTSFDYKPVGIETTRDNVIVYGLDPKAPAGFRIIVLAKEQPLGR